jgi:hypothetical protein
MNQGVTFVEIEQTKDSLSVQFESFVAGHVGGGRIDRQDAMCFVSEYDAGRGMAINLAPVVLARRWCGVR